MTLDISDLIPDMLAAAGGVLQDSWSEAKDYAEAEFRKTAETLALIARLYGDGTISEERARLHLEFQKSSTKTVLLTIEGLGVVAAEQAVNAALGVAKDAVNTTLGFVLI